MRGVGLRRYRVKPVPAREAVAAVAAAVPDDFAHAPHVWRNAALCALCLVRRWWGRRAFRDARAVVAELTLEEIAAAAREYARCFEGDGGFVRNESFEAQMSHIYGGGETR